MGLVSLRLPEWDLLFSPWQIHRDWGNLLRLSRTIRFFFYAYPLLNKFKRNMAVFVIFHHFPGKSSATTTSNRGWFGNAGHRVLHCVPAWKKGIVAIHLVSMMCVCYFDLFWVFRWANTVSTNQATKIVTIVQMHVCSIVFSLSNHEIPDPWWPFVPHQVKVSRF